MEPPPGGPVDTKRPYVSAVSPAPDSLRIARDLHARIAFSEWVNPDIERGKVYLNPPLPRKLKAKLSGNILDITSKARLDTNTTYTLGLLGSVLDLNGLPLESPLELVFSTGSKLDSGRLSGRVLPFQGKPVPGSFAALYPRGAELRARFQHLTRKGDSAMTPEAQPNPAKEKASYLAPADSLGRFAFKAVRPGRYALLGFQDINGNLSPEVGTEALAIGPTLEIGSDAEIKTLTLSAYDTVPLKLVEARWVNEIVRNNQSDGTVRLKFNRAPHPLMSLRREMYVVRKAGPKGSAEGGATMPVLEVCVHPVTGEVELHAAPLNFDSEYVVQCVGLKDAYGNAMDTAHSRAAFRVTRAVDTAKADFVFFGPRKVDGEQERIGMDRLMPGRGFAAYSPKILNDSVFADLKARLLVKADTTPVPVSLVRANHHEFALMMPSLPLKGQKLQISLTLPASQKTAAAVPAKDSASTPSLSKNPAPAKDSLKPAQPAPPGLVTVATFTLADAAKFGSLKFLQQPSAFGSRLVLRSLSSPAEFSRQTPAAGEFVWDSLPEGWYAVDYFRDANGDGIWNPGSLSPWNVQEPYVLWADSAEVKAGAIGDGNGKSGPAKNASPLSGTAPSTGATAPAATQPPAPGSASPEAAGAPPKGTAARKLAWPPSW